MNYNFSNITCCYYAYLIDFKTLILSSTDIWEIGIQYSNESGFQITVNVMMVIESIWTPLIIQHLVFESLEFNTGLNHTFSKICRCYYAYLIEFKHLNHLSPGIWEIGIQYSNES